MEVILDIPELLQLGVHRKHDSLYRIGLMMEHSDGMKLLSQLALR